MEEALEVNKTWYKKVKEWYPITQKPIVFSEVGWATDCADFKQMKNGATNEAREYYEEVAEWSDREQIISYMFEAFDEPWKGETDLMKQKNIGEYSTKTELLNW